MPFYLYGGNGGDNDWLDTRSVKAITSFFAALPQHFLTEGVLGAGEPFLTLRMGGAYESLAEADGWEPLGGEDNGDGDGAAGLLRFTSAHVGEEGNPWRADVTLDLHRAGTRAYASADLRRGAYNAFSGTTHESGSAGDQLLCDLRDGVSLPPGQPRQ